MGLPPDTVGLGVGAGIGRAVGLPPDTVGLGVGAGIGLAVGLNEGAGIGRGVGRTVGAGSAATVGDRVGARALEKTCTSNLPNSPPSMTTSPSIRSLYQPSPKAQQLPSPQAS